MRKKHSSKQLRTQHQFQLKPAYAAVLLAFTVQTVHVQDARANPNDPTVVSGQASFATSGSSLTVTNTPGTIINWQGFSIGANEITRFNQQSASSAVLNRVISSNPSSILGTLQSNGRVFLINPSGIVFGAGSVVDVAGLVASTLKLSDADFLAGRNHFTEIPGAANVSNAGDITAQNGGQIFLIAPNVENTGVITAPNGEILLAAGHSVDLVSTSDPDLRISITAPAGDATNVGKLIASSGSLGLFGTVVRNSGTVSANSATLQGGKIVFRASQRAEISGAVSATGVTGGDIQIQGNQVALIGNASVDASGINAGGTVLIGGDAHGANPAVQNAQQTFVSSDATIKADAVQNGDGGKVVVWADGATLFRGNISAQGGVDGGDGGWVEVSGKQWLDYAGLVNTTAVHGLTGSLLLDPTDITISTAANTMTWTAGTLSYTDTVTTPSNLNITTLQTQLGLSNVTVDTSSALAGTGNITVQDSITWASANSLTLNATGAGAITVNAVTLATGGALTISNTGTGSLSMVTAGGAITLNGTTGGGITLAGGAFTANAGAGTIAIVGTGSTVISTAAGGVNLTAGWIREVGGVISTSGTLTTSSSATGTSLNGGTNMVSALNATDVGMVYLVNGTALNVTGITASDVLINNTGAITTSGAVTASNSVSLNGVGITNNSTITGSLGVSLNAGTGILSNATASSIITNGGGASTGAISLTADKMALTSLAAGNGTVTAGAGAVNIGNSTLTDAINLGSAVDTTANTLELTSAELGTVSTTGLLSIGNASNSGAITVSAAMNLTSNTELVNGAGGIAIGGAITATGKNLTLNTAGAATQTAAITAAGLELLGTGSHTLNNAFNSIGTLAGNTGLVSLTDSTALSVGTVNTVGLTATGAISLTSSGTISQTAAISTLNGLTTSSAGGTTLNNANTVASFNATNSTSGNIALTNTAATLVVTGISQTGGGAITVTNAGSVNVSVGINNTATGLISTQNAISFNATGNLIFNGDGAGASASSGSIVLSGATGVELDNGDWGNAAYTALAGNVTISSTSGSVLAMGGADITGQNITLSAPVGVVNLYGYAGGNINATGIFTLSGGTWNQVAPTLPGFTVNDFRITGGTFIRALGGNGSLATPYLLTDIYGVQGMGSALSSAYALANNIDASGTVNWNAGAGFVPVGAFPGWPTYGIAFTGKLDGMGNTINNLAINRPLTSYVGLFGGLGWGAVVSNVGLVGGSVSGWSTVGALAAYNYGSISSSYVSGMNISGCGSCSNIGGMVGLNDYIINNNSYVSGGTISGGWYVGGLVGKNVSGTIDSSHVIGGIGSSISGSGAVGGLVGWNQNNITGSYVSAGNVSGGSSVGGLAGKNSSTGSIISNSYVDTGTVVSGNVSVGGLLGWDGGEGTFTGNTVTGTTVTGNSFVGGLIGKYSVSVGLSVAGYADNNRVINSFVDGGTVTGLYVGGLVGWNGSSLSNSSVSGTTVKGLSNVGGMVGYNDTAKSFVSGSIVSYRSGYISNSYVDSGSVTGTSAVGGLVGVNNGIVSNSYYNINSVLINGANQVTRYGLFNNVQNINGVGQYDDWFNGGLLTPLNIANYSASLVSAGVDSYTIGDVHGMKDLLGFADNAAYTFSLSANIDLVPVPGYYVPYLAANFDGANFTVSNLNISLPNDKQGLFGHIAPGNSVSNVKLLNAIVAGGNYIGALAGWNEGVIFNSNSTNGTVSGSSYVGGLVGDNMGAVSTSYVSGSTVSGTYAVGGLVGRNIGGAFIGTASSAATIISSYVSGGMVSGNSIVGGLVGQNIGGNGGVGGPVLSIGVGAAGGVGGSATISNSFVSGTTIGGDSNVGGLVGQMLSGNGGIGGYAYYGTGGAGGAGGAATVDNSYVTGATVTGVANNIGGLAGSNISGVAGVNGAGYIGGIGGAGGAAGAAAVSNSYVSGGTVRGMLDVGGLVGNNAGEVTNSYAAAVSVGLTTTVFSATNIGGLAGSNSGKISNSYVSGGTVGASTTAGYFAVAVGGLVGSNSGTISNTYVTGGTVTGYFNVAGLVGVNTLTGSINTSYVASGLVTDCCNSAFGLVDSNAGSIQNSFWDTQTTGQPTNGVGGSPGTNVVGLLTVDMMKMASFTGGWNIANTGGTTGMTWRIYEGQTNPLLMNFLAPLTVTANTGSRTYDGTTNGLGVTYSTPPDANLLGAVVAQTASPNVGSYTVTPSGLYSTQMGYDISYVNGTLTVTPATLTYTANAANRLYGGIDPAFGGSVTGFVLGENLLTATTGTETYSTSALSTSNVGSYAITGSGLTANFGNYVFVQAAGNSTALTIDPATLTATANAATKTYDGLAFTGGNGVTYSGFVNGETNAVLGGTLVYGGTSQGAINAGSYLITPGGLTSGNYTISYVDGVLTVTPANITIAADAATKVYGDADPALTYTVAGMASFDTTATVFTGALARTAGENVATGPYAINQGNLASNANYTITGFTGNVLSITPAPLTVTVNDANKILNTPDPLLTYMVAGLKLSDTEAATLSGELSRAAGETVGIYPINQGTLALTSTNYTMTYVPGRFTILVPTVIDEIVNTSLLFSPDTGSSRSTSSSEEDRVTEEVVVVADTTTAEGTAAPPLPVCN